MIASIAEMESMFGESALADCLCEFTCPLNAEVENFIRYKAIQSSHLSASQTYLVIDDGDYQLLGYFTLVLKAYSVNGAKLSSSNRRLISRFAEEDEAGNFNAAVYLIAQIGKNFSVVPEKQMSGGDLIASALDELRAIKKRIGGKLVMVERESDRPKLLDFYKKNGFRSWTSRLNAKDGVLYDQMFMVLNDIKETA